MLDPPLPILDAEIRAAAQAVRRARDELRLEGVAEDPLGERRQVSSRYMFLELADEKDPVAPSARAWVAWLTLERVLWRDTARVGAAWHARSLRVDKLAAGELSPREARARVLGDPDPERRRAWGMALARGVGGLADAVRIRAERRAEATRLLDAAEVERVEQPFEPADAVRAAAEAWLATTDALVERRQSFTDALYAALGREAADGWPAKLGTRWLADLFRATGLTDGLSLDVGPLPVVLGATRSARPRRLRRRPRRRRSAARGAVRDDPRTGGPAPRAPRRPLCRPGRGATVRAPRARPRRRRGSRASAACRASAAPRHATGRRARAAARRAPRAGAGARVPGRGHHRARPRRRHPREPGRRAAAAAPR
ncbi:MAG: hypothetical protein WKG00_17045 [Polyangiaceae bacterium]